MIAIGLKALGFARGNWTWLLPTLGMVAALAWGSVAQIGWESCSAAAARQEADQQKAIAKQAQQDATLRGQIAAEQAETNARTTGTEAKYVEVVRNVVITKDCAASPAMRAADDGLRALGFSDQAPGAGGAAPEAKGAAARPKRRAGQRHRRRAHPVRRCLSAAGGGLRRPALLGAGEEAAVLKVADGERA